MGAHDTIDNFIEALLDSEPWGRQVAFHRLMEDVAMEYDQLVRPLPDPLNRLLRQMGIKRLYRHQVQALNLIRSGRHVVLATPTASGKSMAYLLPTLENWLDQSQSSALYLFPLKALAQDQLRQFELMANKLGNPGPTAAIYDGDTSQKQRKQIKEKLPDVIMTNPDMLHLAFLPYHVQWKAFFKNLEVVVLDEIHVYRGILGSHIAQVIRRFRRICEFYGSFPTFVFCSATVGNPAQLAGQLSGVDVSAVNLDNATRGKRHIVCLNPPDGLTSTTLALLKSALDRKLRTIVFTQSRKLAELVTLWTQSRSRDLTDKISVYRAGLTPKERRAIESDLSSGKLLAVIATSALELGIDIGDLDLCILMGYPGSIVATRQRSGRVGRRGRDSALILVAGQDALDQYFVKNPHELIARQPETAVLNPSNPNVLCDHWICAAAELPLRIQEPYLNIGEDLRRPTLEDLVDNGSLLISKDGEKYYSKKRYPHRTVNLRGIGDRYRIIHDETGGLLGEIDEYRAFKETHPGAVYLHNTRSHIVKEMDIDTRSIRVIRADVDYYTKIRSDEDIHVIDEMENKALFNTQIYYGKLSVEEMVTGYEMWRILGHQRVEVIPLDLPKMTFHTEGLWFDIPDTIQRRVTDDKLDFLGGIHALEHATIGILPLLVMADRNDLGGVSTMIHPQTKGAVIFIYDGIPGGAGLCLQAYEKAAILLEKTLSVITRCPCDNGCPSCVHSPKCGSGNRPIDKIAARHILEDLLKADSSRNVGRPERIVNNKLKESKPVSAVRNDYANQVTHFGVFDVETQRSAQEVGGWHRADRMRISCVVLYDSQKDRYFEFLENQVNELIDHLEGMDLVIGFNLKRFDYNVLSGYQGFDARRLRTLDILEHVYNHLGFRLSLNHLAKMNLGVEKSADGLQALRWWKQGRIRDILNYCRKDVEITKDLYLYGQNHGHLLFRDKMERILRIPVKWKNPF